MTSAMADSDVKETSHTPTDIRQALSRRGLSVWADPFANGAAATFEVRFRPSGPLVSRNESLSRRS